MHYSLILNLISLAMQREIFLTNSNWVFLVKCRYFVEEYTVWVNCLDASDVTILFIHFRNSLLPSANMSSVRVPTSTHRPYIPIREDEMRLYSDTSQVDVYISAF